MNSNRIKEIQEGTAYPESVSVMLALNQVWNECEQEQVKNLTTPVIVSHMCPDPTHHAMEIGILDKCATCGAAD